MALEIFSLKTLQYRQFNDEQKKNICKDLKITLITVPYWWDIKLDSLKATIYKLRPELFVEPPQGKFGREKILRFFSIFFSIFFYFFFFFYYFQFLLLLIFIIFF